MKLSIVIVNYKTPDLLLQCIRCIQENSIEMGFEICVVDNHSGDESVVSLRTSFPWVNIIENEKNIGYGAANNIGINGTTGSYVMLLNPDTFLPRDAIVKLITYLDLHPDTGAVGPKMIRKDGRFDKACRRSFPTPDIAFYRLFGVNKIFPGNEKYNRYNYDYESTDTEMEVDSLMGACMVVRREALEEAGLFDDRYFLYGEDIDLCYRIKQSGWAILYYPEVTVIHLKGESSRKNISRSIFEFYKAMYLFHKKYFESRTFFLINWLVYLGIGVLYLVEIIKNLFKRPEKKGVASAAR